MTDADSGDDRDEAAPDRDPDDAPASDGPDGDAASAEGGDAPDDRMSIIKEQRAEINRLREQLDALEDRVDDRTVDRDSLEGDLRRYVRRRLRSGHARGWGPYLVLLYGTAMTLGAFLYLDGGWAVLAMLVVWLSTLGLYTLMLLVGVGLGAFGSIGKAYDWVQGRRS